MAKLDPTELWNVVQTCHLEGLNQGHLTPEDLNRALSGLLPNPLVKIKLLGESAQGRPIYSYVFGRGSLPVLAWSQMHGNEPTATASLLDLLNGFIHQSSHPWFAAVLDTFTITLVPQLNPDGAHVCSRENAQGLDINRDALALQTPEGQILSALLNHHRKGIAFNLHDQSRDYANGVTGEPVNLAFLCPPADPNFSLTPARSKAIRIIGEWVDGLKQIGDYSLTRYQDDYTDTAFGELASALSWSCILIESAPGWKDPNRQTARKLTLFCLLHGLQQVVFGHSTKDHSDKYLQLPLNQENVYVERLWRNVSIHYGQIQFHADFGINEEQSVNCLAQLGDLRNLRGYQEQDYLGYEWLPLKTMQVDGPTVLDNQAHLSWLKNGIGQVYDPQGWIEHRSDYPLIYVDLEGKSLMESMPIKGQPLSGQIVHRGRVCKVLIKGRMFDL